MGMKPERNAANIYKKEVLKIPRISEIREKELGKRIIAHNDKAAINELVTSNLDLALQLGKFKATKLRSGAMGADDFIQAANIGLMKAAQKFDYRKGASFRTYARWWMDVEMLRTYLSEGLHIGIPAHVKEDMSKILRFAGKLGEESGRPPTIAELAKATKLSQERVRLALNASHIEVTSLQAPIGEDPGNTMENIIGAPSPILKNDPIDLQRDLEAVRFEIKTIYAEAAAKGTPAEIKAFRLYYEKLHKLESQSDRRERLSTYALGKELGMTGAAVSDNIKRLWKKMGYTGNITESPLAKAIRKASVLEEKLSLMLRQPSIEN